MLRLCPHLRPPRGHTRKAPAPLRSARAAASLPPFSPPGGFADRFARSGRSMVFHWPGCVRPGTGGGRVLLPLTASHGSGAHGGGRPLAAARGCRLLRRFFFLLRRRNVILAGPRPGQASLRSVRQRTLDMACSARIGTAQEGGRTSTNAAATGRFAARGRTACFYSPPPRHDLAVRGEHRYPQVHRCSTQPSEKSLGRRPLKFLTP